MTRRGRGDGGERGFTIVELSVVLLLLGLAMAMMFSFLNAATETTARTAANTQSEADSQLVTRTLTSDLRSAYSISSVYPTSGSCPGTSFTSSPYTDFRLCIRVTILRPTTGGQLCPKTDVTYGVVGGKLLMDRVVYAGTTDACNAVSTTLGKVLLTNVTNDSSNPLFTYYDRTGKDLLAASPAISPVSSGSIKVTLSKRYRAQRSSVVTFSDVVALRNKR